MQIFLNGADELIKLLSSLSVDTIFVLHGNSYHNTNIKKVINKSRANIVSYTDFNPNPRYEQVCAASDAFDAGGAGVIVAVGGGSAIDTAKYVKMNHLSTPFIAIPTTAGSGSESTKFLVYYLDGEKKSLSDDCILPEYVLLVGDELGSLPIDQKHCTFADALCQAIEAWWSIHATKESRKYSRKAIELLIENANAYFNNAPNVFEAVMKGSNYAGRAINIAQTTAAHAMSYKLTTMFNLPHGYSVALCLPETWAYLNRVSEQGSEIEKTLSDISDALGFRNAKEAPNLLRKMFFSWGLTPPCEVRAEQITELSEKINLERLKNFPVLLDVKEVRNLYEKIFRR